MNVELKYYNNAFSEVVNHSLSILHGCEDAKPQKA